MTTEEFVDWYAVHRAAIPSIHLFISKLPENKSPGHPSQREVLIGWAQILSDVELIDAQKATRLLANGDEVSDWPDAKAVRAIAKRFASARIFEKYRESGAVKNEEDGPRYHCADCLDRGWVTCINPKVVRFINRNYDHLRGSEKDQLPEMWRTHPDYPAAMGDGRVALQCTCEKGQKIRNSAKRDEAYAATYNHQTMCPVSYSPTNDLYEALKWLDRYWSGEFSSADSFDYMGPE